jgi:hypothetical protein
MKKDKSPSKPSASPLHELRFYRIASGKVADYVAHAGAVAVRFRGDRYGKLLGFWSCEIGAMSCVFNLWEHESVATREALRAELQSQDVWRNDYLPHSQPLMQRQLSRLLKPMSSVKPPTTTGNLFLMRIFRTRAGKTQAFAEHLESALPPGLAAQAIATWTGNTGEVNEVVHLSACAQTESLSNILQTAQWDAFLKAHGALVEDVESSLMLPAPFSPWR